MTARIPIRTSKWANRAYRIGLFAIPVLIICVVGSHFDYFGELETFAVLGVGFLFAFVAIVLAIIALSEIWSTGHRGFGRAIGGLFFGIVGFAPALVLGAAVLVYPQVTDISSDIIEPPILSVQGPGDAARIARATMGGVVHEDLYGLLLELPIDEVYKIILPIVEARKWTIIRNVPPGNGRTIVSVEVVTRTPLLRLKDRATIRLTHFPQRTLVDMRSATLRGRMDFGANHRRIVTFFDDIISALEADQPEPDTDSEDGDGESRG